MSIVTRGKAWFAATKERGQRGLSAARERSPALDHLIRAYRRYEGERGNQLAGAVTFFGFLSFFPLLALAFAVAGYAVVIYPEARQQLLEGVRSVIPVSGALDVRNLAEARKGAGLFGLLGLLVSGIGWITALRESLHRIWLKDPTGGGNFVVKNLIAVAVLIALGLCLLASVAVSSLATSATRMILGFAELGDSVVASWGLRVLAVAVVLLFDMLLFLVMFSQLSGSRQPWRELAGGALLAAVGFEILKLVGTAYVPAVANDPVYGTFGLVVGLLVWINLISRLTLFAGSWTATSPASEARHAASAAGEGERAGTVPSATS